MYRSITKRRFSSKPQRRESLGKLIQVLSQSFRIHSAALLHAGELVG